MLLLFWEGFLQTFTKYNILCGNASISPFCSPHPWYPTHPPLPLGSHPSSTTFGILPSLTPLSLFLIFPLMLIPSCEKKSLPDNLKAWKLWKLLLKAWFIAEILLVSFINISLEDALLNQLNCSFFNWDLVHIRLNSHFQTWSYQKAKKTKMKSISESQPKTNFRLNAIYRSKESILQWKMSRF